MAGSLLRQFGPRLFSSSGILTGKAGFMHANGPGVVEATGLAWARFPVLGVRNGSSLALGEEGEEKGVQTGSTGASSGGPEGKAIVSYWGVPSAKVTKEDGSDWRWNCFRPWETYKADMSIDLKKHHVPVTFMDRLAYWTVKALRFPTDVFFQRRYGCRAMMLETVAAVPGMVGGMLLHCKSLRRFEHSGGWIKALLEEAENERMHLMTFMEVANPNWYERALVFTVQGVFFNAYFLAYMASPKLAHRVVGYLEEEAIHSYTEFLKELDKGNIENVPAPAIAIDYWRLPPGSTLRDVVMVVRADEAHHRDVNHFASDIHYQGHELREFVNAWRQEVQQRVLRKDRANFSGVPQCGLGKGIDVRFLVLLMADKEKGNNPRFGAAEWYRWKRSCRFIGRNPEILFFGIKSKKRKAKIFPNWVIVGGDQTRVWRDEIHALYRLPVISSTLISGEHTMVGVELDVEKSMDSENMSCICLGAERCMEMENQFEEEVNLEGWQNFMTVTEEAIPTINKKAIPAPINENDVFVRSSAKLPSKLGI
ncbi:hypothetical protein HHK36_000846 [Tetracentron sinense]|uniref:Ubiquinol oxidase n=1 Tax=Tetracentron sinense TaxID=13715 RepID=A0A834ZRR8_TETSI|nr:hypothetical protein HHK36_000846 [Tetracentron sinense]